MYGYTDKYIQVCRQLAPIRLILSTTLHPTPECGVQRVRRGIKVRNVKGVPEGAEGKMLQNEKGLLERREYIRVPIENDI